MRKAIALVIMIVVCSIYFIAMNYTDEGIGMGKKLGLGEGKISYPKDTIEKIIMEIETEYPATPKMLMELNNHIMQCQYSEDSDDDVIIETVKALRMLYSNDLLQLNSYEKQLENLKDELDKNHADKLYLTRSTIKTIVFPSPENALVEVLHETTKKSERREYRLVKEKGLWKIHSWSNLFLIQDETILED